MQVNPGHNHDRFRAYSLVTRRSTFAALSPAGVGCPSGPGC